MKRLKEILTAFINHCRNWYIWNADCQGIDCDDCPVQEKCDEEDCE